ncbi:MAG: hypothetical protein HC902_07675 [Calothrix sp. SM1_5_4]|nr:hypothetical protein [Calothrix sp. SM1_5_4]
MKSMIRILGLLASFVAGNISVSTPQEPTQDRSNKVNVVKVDLEDMVAVGQWEVR